MTTPGPTPASPAQIELNLRRAAELLEEIEIDLRQGIHVEDTERVAFVQMLSAAAQTHLKRAETEMAFADWLKRQ